VFHHARGEVICDIACRYFHLLIRSIIPKEAPSTIHNLFFKQDCKIVSQRIWVAKLRSLVFMFCRRWHPNMHQPFLTRTMRGACTPRQRLRIPKVIISDPDFIHQMYILPTISLIFPCSCSCSCLWVFGQRSCSHVDIFLTIKTEKSTPPSGHHCSPFTYTYPYDLQHIKF
jgi:hypothetical protein